MLIGSITEALAVACLAVAAFLIAGVPAALIVVGLYFGYLAHFGATADRTVKVTRPKWLTRGDS